ncbi:MAG: hypothetical protein KH268_09080 [Clostridiales bacterium]|nr:hypothetical protein [Clostridiales bacterium]
MKEYDQPFDWSIFLQQNTFGTESHPAGSHLPLLFAAGRDHLTFSAGFSLIRTGERYEA